MKSFEAKHYLLRAQMLWDRVEDKNAYPFSLPVLNNFDSLEFHPEVTFLVGENGAGKSTLIEGIAKAWGFNAEGGSINFNFETVDTNVDLKKHLRLAKGIRKAKDGFFLRAESYFNVATQVDDLAAAHNYGGKSLHAQSHGESFFALFEKRFWGNGLYILDEPEAALSPTRQLSLLGRMHDLVAKNSQFIIATHSPIIMAYPDAWIYQISSSGINRVAYEDTEHYQVTKAFLANPKRMLDELFLKPEDTD
jgi:predicted ATPase